MPLLSRIDTLWNDSERQLGLMLVDLVMKLS